MHQQGGASSQEVDDYLNNFTDGSSSKKPSGPSKKAPIRPRAPQPHSDEVWKRAIIDRIVSLETRFSLVEAQLARIEAQLKAPVDNDPRGVKNPPLVKICNLENT